MDLLPAINWDLVTTILAIAFLVTVGANLLAAGWAQVIGRR
jgi:hypothetical protein